MTRRIPHQMPNQTIAVIGLGRFGGRLARNLAAAGRDVIAVDTDRALIEAIRDDVTVAVAMDATDENALRAQGIHRADAVVVGIGQDFEAVVLCTVTLKAMGVPRVIARAANATSARVLERVGADRVVMPEDESADRWAYQLIGPDVLNRIEFHEGHAIVEWPVPPSWVGQSLAQLDVRAKLGLHVVAIRRAGPAPEAPEAKPQRGARPAQEDASKGPRITLPGPQEPLHAGDVLILMGREEDITRLPRS